MKFSVHTRATGKVKIMWALESTDKSKAKKSCTIWSAQASRDLQTAANEHGFQGKTKEVFWYVSNTDSVLCIGLGPKKELSGESWREAMGRGVRELKSHHMQIADIDVFDLSSTELSIAVPALIEGARYVDYQYDDLKKTDESRSTVKELRLILSKTSKAIDQQIAETVAVMDAIDWARRVADTPGNLMTPTKLAQEAQKAAAGKGIKVTVWDKSRLKKERMGGVLSVALGSAQDPRFIIMEYTGPGAAKKQPICFVGKGLTFDTGGISIKPSQAMDEMKYDMCGGANVIGTVLALAAVKAKVKVIALVPATENMPGPAALKPGDVVYARNGTSVEVLNTDAEGRLILMDALCYAAEQNPAAIIDAATLTGAILMALSNVYTGFFTRHEKLKASIESSAQTTQEKLWHMPLDDHFTKDMKGHHADLSNISSFKGAGSSTAAAFLETFVPKEIPWAHFDIAGTAWSVENRLGYINKKTATGVMIRTFMNLAQSYKN